MMSEKDWITEKYIIYDVKPNMLYRKLRDYINRLRNLTPRGR